MSSESGCPFTGGSQKLKARHQPGNRDWWPNYLNLSILHQHSPKANPMGEAFNYASEFKSLDLDAVRKDIYDLMTMMPKLLQKLQLSTTKNPILRVLA
ncbi:MAG: hypothetical protein WBB28_10110 [Crinalium sp.]